jgi:two-component system, sensor histidine kinase
MARATRAGSTTKRRLLRQPRRARTAAGRKKPVPVLAGLAELVRTANHDLRQPLHAARFFAEIVASRVADPRLAELAKHLVRAVEQTDGLLDSILDLVRLEAKLVRPKMRTVRVADIFNDLERQFRPHAAAKGLRLRIVPTSAAVRSDPDLLAQMLRCLIARALRTTDRGGLLLGVRRARGRLRMALYDTGPATLPANAKAAFADRFDSESARADGGLALELAIVRRLAALTRHVIGHRRVTARGTCYWIEFSEARRARSP